MALGKSLTMVEKSMRTVSIWLFLLPTCYVTLWVMGQVLSNDLVEINPPKSASEDQVIALSGALLVDGLGGPPVNDSVVIVRGDTIIAAGPRENISIPEGCRVIDASGSTLLPGFVDSHFHSINDLGPPRRFLANGVTTFRDPGHPFRFYQAVLQSKEPMPRVFLCGEHLDAYPPIWPQQAALISSSEQARETVNKHVDQGATAIKIYFRLPLEYFSVICKTANDRGVPVTAHLELVKASDAIDAGIHGVEHVTSFGTSLSNDAAASQFETTVAADPDLRDKLRYRLWSTINFDSPSRCEKILDKIVQRSVYVSPTLAVFERRAHFDKVTDEEVRGYENMLRFVGMCHKAGATLVAGSHTWVPGAEFGWALQRELELLVECGLTPLEAITAATLNGAKFLQTDDRLGSIEVGKLADIVLVEGDPTADISQLRKVKRVMLSGLWVTNPSSEK